MHQFVSIYNPCGRPLNQTRISGKGGTYGLSLITLALIAAFVGSVVVLDEIGFRP